MMESEPTIDILVPTFQRVDVLLKNLKHLLGRIAIEAEGKARILVRDNASSDGTADRVNAFMESNPDAPIVFHTNDSNIGVEPNCIGLLDQANAPYVMYMGDDDYIAEGYLEFVLNEIAEKPETTAVISGYSFLHPDESVTPERCEDFDIKRYPSTEQNVGQLMPLGHQLSGLMFRREGMHDAYLARSDCRNLYPFIFFVGYCAQRGQCVYAPKFQTLVSKIAVRHWSYDKSDLLRDALMNYQLLFDGQPTKRFSAQFKYLCRNWGKIGGENILRLPFAFFQVVTWPGLDWLTRIALVACLPFLVVRAIFYSIPKIFRPLARRAA